LTYLGMTLSVLSPERCAPAGNAPGSAADELAVDAMRTLERRRG
jgi:hypothetical protein